MNSNRWIYVGLNLSHWITPKNFLSLRTMPVDCVKFFVDHTLALWTDRLVHHAPEAIFKVF